MKTSKRVLVALIALLLATMTVLVSCEDVTKSEGNTGTDDSTNSSTADNSTTTEDGNGDGTVGGGDGTVDGGNGDGDPSCQHVFEGEYFSDATGHWRKCHCGTKETVTSHNPADAVIENQTAGDCGNEGCYDEVVYCSVCNYKISSEHKIVSPTGEHTQAEPVKENETASTCSVKGTYDEVTYCSVCKKQILRITKQQDFAPHSLEILSNTPATCEENGAVIKKCKNCEYTETQTIQQLSHVYGTNDQCVCGAHKASVGLTATPSGDGTSCTISGLGSFSGTTIYIPAEIGGVPVTGIDADAFKDNTDIIAIYFSDAITSIGDNAFYGCTNLQKIVFSNSIKSIGKYAFYGCSSLEKIIIPNSVETIGNYAFHGCENVTKIVIGEGVTTIGGYAFYGCKKLTRLEFNAVSCADLGQYHNNFLYGGRNSGGFDVVIGEKVTRIPAYLISFTTTVSMGDSDLASKTAVIKSLTFPGNGVCTEIGSYAFRAYFVPHTVVFIPKYVTTIKASAFAGSIKWSSNANDYTSMAYSDVFLAFEESSAPSTFASQWNNAGMTFSYGGAITGTTISYIFGATRKHGVTDDGYYWVMLDDGTICVYDVKDTVTVADIPSTINGVKVTQIAHNAFAFNPRLTKAVIPEHVTYVGGTIFYHNLSLVTIEYRATNAQMKDIILSYAKGATVPSDGGTLIIGSGVKVLPQYILRRPGASSTTDHYINKVIFEPTSTCEIIKQYAFYGNLSYIVIPKSVKTIEYSAISCSSAKIFYGGNVADWNEITIGNSNSYYTRYYYCDTTPECDGYYWKYVNGIPETVTFVPDPNNRTSVGLSYTISTDGKYYIVSGVGTCEDTEIIIPAVFNGLPVKEIANNAFYNKTAITSFSIPDSITSIGYNAFYNTAFINNTENYVDGALYIGKALIATTSDLPVNYTVKAGTTVIGAYAFKSATATTVTLPDSVKYISKYAFWGHTKLTTLNLSKNIVSIGEYAFYNCKNLEGSISIPAGQTTVYTYTFYNCMKLTEIIIPEGVTRIDENAFYGCAALTEIKLPSTLTYIGTIFTNCSSLKSVTIPNGVTYLPDGLFKGCYALESLELPFIGRTSTSTGGAGILGHLFYQNSASGDLTVTITQQYGFSNSGSYAIPVSLKKIKLNGGLVDFGCFSGCTMLQEVILPEGLKTINYKAFYGCLNLMKVNIPSTVTTIAYDAFVNCYKLYEVQNLSELDIVKGDDTSKYGYVSKYARYVYGADGQSKYVTTTDGYVFFVNGDDIILCDYIGKDINLSLPENYEGLPYEIGAAAFYNRTDLQAVNVPKNVTHIGAYAFYNCQNIEHEIVIPTSQKIIEPYTFYNCKKLPKAVIPEAVTKIGDSAFYCCESLTELTIPAAVKSIGTDAFYYCRGVTKLTFNAVTLDDLEYSSSKNMVFANFGSSNGVDVVFGKRVESIPAYLFNRVANIKSISFEKASVCEKIGNQAFSRCTKLETLTIPESVTEIPASLLLGCTSLKEITVPFVGTNKNATSAGQDTLFTYIFSSENQTNSTQVTQYYDATNSIKRYVPTSLTKITVLGGNLYYGALSGLTNVTEIILGEDVSAEFGVRAFYNCSKMTTINIMGKVTSIGADAFRYCVALQTVFLYEDARQNWSSVTFENEYSNPQYNGASLGGVVTPGGGNLMT